MEEKVWQFMQKYHMVEEKDRIVAGISGGGDSMALLFLLLRFQVRCGYELCVVHVNHGIRGEEAQLDQNLVEEFCQRRGVECRVFHYPVPEIAREKGWSEEEAGREVRRMAYRQTAKEWRGTKIALAHHQNDQAETLIHHLSRGCGLRGMRGMLPVQAEVIRPFLCIERGEIEHYLEEKKIPYRTDITNLFDRYVRNCIRHHVVEYLEKNVNAKAVAHMAGTARVAAEVEEHLSAEGEEILGRQGQVESDHILLRSTWQQEKHILQIYGLLSALERLTGQRKDLSAEHLEQVLSLFHKDTGKQVSIPGKITAYRTYQGVVLRRDVEKTEESCEKMWTLPFSGRILCGKDLWETRIFSYECQKIPEKKYTKWFDYDKIKTTLQIRNRRPGDWIVVNAQGGGKKLKDYLIDEKVPRDQRERLTLLAEEGEILWVVGMRVSEAYKISEFTKRVLEVKYQGGREIE